MNTARIISMYHIVKSDRINKLNNINIRDRYYTCKCAAKYVVKLL